MLVMILRSVATLWDLTRVNVGMDFVVMAFYALVSSLLDEFCSLFYRQLFAIQF